MNSTCREIDPEYIQRLMTHKKHKERKKLIRKFLFNNYFNNYRQIQDIKEKFIIKNSYNFCKVLLPISIGLSFVIYKIFFTGIYEIRSFYFNTNKIPFMIKLLLSSMGGVYLFNQLWMDYTYNSDMYELALKYYK